ncbi:hypothetical protein [Baaleninema simplex]|uniref:hypothetical protein n=1 Tax=Baaleninema simplex TaxID=2862350 RepID=UPI0003497F74|nr:hypothetical protein [Baaleninema simplex]
MPIPVKKVPVQLNSNTPTPLTSEELQKQLNNVGLTCSDTDPKKLKEYINEVKGQLPVGAVQTYGIYAPQQGEQKSNRVYYRSEFQLEQLAESGYSAEVVYAGLAKSSEGNWEPSNTGAGYSTELSYIQYPEHFDYLYNNKPGFTGVKDVQPPYTGRYSTVDAIKQLFVQVGTNASSVLVKGLDKDSIESVLSNAIAPLDDTQVRDYDKSDNRVIFLVDNYNPGKEECDGIGVLTINWRLVIKDYKKKKEALKHDTTLTITARAVLYSDLDSLYSDKAFVESHFKDKLFRVSNWLVRGIPIKPSKVEIFTNLPPANKETFDKSLPKIAKENFVEVIVLYSPDLDNIGCLDNTNSDASSSYSVSVAQGFTFTTSQSFSLEFSYEASAEIVKAGFKIGFNLTFTEQWSTTTTETIQFSAPAGTKAFTYQGYLLSAILRYNPSDQTYKYVEYGKLKTNIVTTTRTPIEEASS